MQNVLPAVTGLTVDGVIYQYTTVKNPQDPMTVSVQNYNSTGTGFIFRSVDDWTARPGNSITKVVPLDNIPISYWGDGEIAVSGQGTVKNASVVYKYRYDTCVNDPLSSPACPGYDVAMLKKVIDRSVEPIDPLSDQYVRAALDNKTTLEDEKKILDLSSRDKKNEGKDTRDKKILNNTMISAQDAKVVSQFEMLNNIPGLDLYRINIPGGVYNDVLKMPDKKLPDSRNARRLGVAQESLHKALVDSQYNN